MIKMSFINLMKDFSFLFGLFSVPVRGFFSFRRALWAFHSARPRAFSLSMGTLSFPQCPDGGFFPLNGHSGLFSVPVRGFFSSHWALWTLLSARPKAFSLSMGTHQLFTFGFHHQNVLHCPYSTFSTWKTGTRTCSPLSSVMFV